MEPFDGRRVVKKMDFQGKKRKGRDLFPPSPFWEWRLAAGEQIDLVWEAEKKGGGGAVFWGNLLERKLEEEERGSGGIDSQLPLGCSSSKTTQMCRAVSEWRPFPSPTYAVLPSLPTTQLCAPTQTPLSHSPRTLIPSFPTTPLSDTQSHRLTDFQRSPAGSSLSQQGQTTK